MGIQVYTDPPRVVYEMVDLTTDISTSKQYAGAYPTNNEAVYGTFMRQRGHSFSVSYAVRNGGPTNNASGLWSKSEAFLQGLTPNPNFDDGATQENYDGDDNILDATMNLFDEPTATYEDTTVTTSLSGPVHNGVFSTHDFTFQHERLVSYEAAIRVDVLQALITAYPQGTITFLVNVPGSQTQEWDIHGGFAYVSVLYTQVWNTPESTFPLSAFGVTPDDGWLTFPVTGGTWSRNCVSGGTFGRTCVSGGTFTRGDVTNG